jgi:hypothetical protein
MNCQKRLLFLMLAVFLCWMPVQIGRSQSGNAVEQQSKFKRLILKDGSYELISQYEVRDGRVRYFSSERHAWEEMPYDLVDWAATERYAGQESRDLSARKSEALDRAAEERREDEAREPAVAAGLKIPYPDGVYLLDTYQNKPELNRLAQNGADLNKNIKKNILRGAINPIAGSKQTVELKGLHAQVQAHVPTPSIYFSIDASDPLTDYTSETAKDHLRIVRCEQKDGDRVVAAFDIAVYGKVKQRAQYLEARVEPISQYWVRVAPLNALPPGEYALVEIDGKGALNQFVWDFGIDPAAPPNLDVLESSPEKGAPVLIQKPRKK